MTNDLPESHERWAHLRFSVIGPLLASPPKRGELKQELHRLSRKLWQHPVSGHEVRFATSTIERWYYTALQSSDPVAALRRKARRDRGRSRAVSSALGQALRIQYDAHPSWSYQLHLDNLEVRIQEKSELGALPSYSSLRRHMMAHGLPRQRRRRNKQESAKDFEPRESRSYEAEYVSGLWHLDFHHGSLSITTPEGEWVRPILLAILDDRSRLICHAQWYLDETTSSLVHGLSQAFLKRGLPRSLMTDNGSAMIAYETRQGLKRLGIVHETTLPEHPEQNGKQEVLWAQVEGRLLAMLEGQADLTLSLLNRATQAWVEMEYHQSVHSETDQRPLVRFLQGPCVGRECPSVEDLRLAFTVSQSRTQRRSDGTISVLGVRFEIPTRFRHFPKLQIRYASWDLRSVWLMDEVSACALERIFPLDKVRNAERARQPLIRTSPTPEPQQPPGIAPLLRKLMAEYAATGLPPAYLEKEETKT